ncbi:MAG TPA: M50 family metallopeptidase, partial [Chitinophagales bacterium]|nr:M50 family metallopeptidase [Chitinophagales bacterium]
ITERFPFVIAGFGDASVAEKSGLKKDDQVIAVNGEPTFFFDEVRDALTRNKGDTIRVTALRGTDTVHQAVALGNDGLLGVFTKTSPDYFPVAVKEYTLAQSFPAGYHKAKKTLTDYIRQFKLIFNRDIEGYKHLGGFISIGKAFSPQWDWVNFWSFTAFLSIALAFMNLLPIPALDGGHVVFTLYEMVTRRKPNEKFLEYAQIAGMVILLSLMAYANGNDIVKLFR